MSSLLPTLRISFTATRYSMNWFEDLFFQIIMARSTQGRKEQTWEFLSRSEIGWGQEEGEIRREIRTRTTEAKVSSPSNTRSACDTDKSLCVTGKLVLNSQLASPTPADDSVPSILLKFADWHCTSHSCNPINCIVRPIGEWAGTDSASTHWIRNFSNFQKLNVHSGWKAWDFDILQSWISTITLAKHPVCQASFLERFHLGPQW